MIHENLKGYASATSIVLSKKDHLVFLAAFQGLSSRRDYKRKQNKIDPGSVIFLLMDCFTFSSLSEIFQMIDCFTFSSLIDITYDLNIQIKSLDLPTCI